MKKEKSYIYLYYLCFILSIIIYIIPYQFIVIFSPDTSNLTIRSLFNTVVLLINLILVILFSVYLKKKKFTPGNIIMPITYIVFWITVITVCFLFNSRLVIPNLQFVYYAKYIYIGYLILNVYSILCFKNKKK